jgi:hypothetical protein
LNKPRFKATGDSKNEKIALFVLEVSLSETTKSRNDETKKMKVAVLLPVFG